MRIPMLTLLIRPSGRPTFAAALLRAACLLGTLWAVAVFVPAAGAQAPDAPVGRIEGENVSVRGEVRVVTENGHTYTALASGSQVTVRSGRARIELAAGGGEIGICGCALIVVESSYAEIGTFRSPPPASTYALLLRHPPRPMAPQHLLHGPDAQSIRRLHWDVPRGGWKLCQ